MWLFIENIAPPLLRLVNYIASYYSKLPPPALYSWASSNGFAVSLQNSQSFASGKKHISIAKVRTKYMHGRFFNAWHFLVSVGLASLANYVVGLWHSMRFTYTYGCEYECSYSVQTLCCWCWWYIIDCSVLDQLRVIFLQVYCWVEASYSLVAKKASHMHTGLLHRFWCALYRMYAAFLQIIITRACMEHEWAHGAIRKIQTPAMTVFNDI